MREGEKNLERKRKVLNRANFDIDRVKRVVYINFD